MNRERYLQNETNLRLQDNAGSLLPFSAGTTLTRNQRVFPIRAYLNKVRPIFFTLFLFMIFSGCGPSKAEMEKQQLDPREVNYNISIIKVDSCEYIIYNSRTIDGTIISICHKGNCKNCSTKKYNHE